MNNKQYHILIDIINILLRFMAAYTIIGAAILFTAGTTESAIRSVILLPAPIISYLIGKYSKRIWSFFLLHLIMITVYAFTSHNGFVLAFYLIYLVILTITALKKRLQEERPRKTNTSLLLLSVFPAIYLLNHHLGITELNGFIFVSVTLFILLYLLNMYLINFESFFQTHSNMSNVPIKQIKSTNHMLILFFGCLCIVIMLFFTTLPLKGLLSVTGSLLLSLLKAFFSLFPNKENETAPLNPTNQDTGASPFDLMKTSEPSLILQYIQNILLGLVTIAMIAGGIALVLYSLYRIYQRFYGKKYNNFRDTTEFVSPFDQKEKIIKEGHKTILNRFFDTFSHTNSDKIRRHFYKAVLSQKKGETLSGGLTPLQLSEYALKGQSGLSAENTDIRMARQLALYYEKARYSKEECTKEEVIQVKKIIKNI